MDISDLLKMFGDGVGGNAPLGANPTPTAIPNAQPGEGGIAQLLSGAAPDAMAANNPAGLSAQPPDPPPMADESSLGMPVAPSTPPSTDHGLGSFLSHMVQKATTRNPETGMSFVDKLGDLGASITDSAGSTQGASRQIAKDAAGRVTATQDETKRQEIAKMADTLGMSPREKLLFMSNPDAWAKANADRMGFHDVAGGHTILEGDPSAGGSTGFAPLVGVQNGEGYTATPTATTATGALPVSPEQQLKAELAQAQEASLDKYHKAMAAAATTRANKPTKAPLGNGGYGLPRGYVPR